MAKIKIKPSKKGSFTKWCKRKGYDSVTEECISSGKSSSNKAIRKKATFAKNARKWKKGKFGMTIDDNLIELLKEKLK